MENLNGFQDAFYKDASAEDTVERIRRILEVLHSDVSVTQMFVCLESGKNPLDPVVLHCDMQCKPECRLLERCSKKQTDRLARLIRDMSAELDQRPMIEDLKALNVH